MDKGSYPHEQEVLLLDGKKFVVLARNVIAYSVMLAISIVIISGYANIAQSLRTGMIIITTRSLKKQ